MQTVPLNSTHRSAEPFAALTDDTRQLLEALPQPLLLLDRHEHIAFVNRAAECLVGTSGAQLLGRIWREAISLSHASVCGLDTNWGRGGERPTPTERNYLLTRHDGGERVVQLSDVPMPDGALASRVILLQDCTVAWDRIRQLKHHCSRDHLTNLVNRREFEQRLACLVNRARQDSSANVLAFMDLDHFKGVNDEHGHMAGDSILQGVAALLAKSIRGRDTLARLGGDEFGLLMEHCSALEAVKAGKALAELLSRHKFDWQGHELSIGVSIGLVVIDQSCADDRELLAQADSACYAAKSNPEIKVQLYAPTEHLR